MTHFPNIYGSEDKVNPADRGLMVFDQQLLNSRLEVCIYQYSVFNSDVFYGVFAEF